MKQYGQRFNCPAKLKLVSALGKEHPDPCSFTRAVSWLGGHHVLARRAHCWSNVANRAHVRAIAKLRNQSELTHPAAFGEEDGKVVSGSMEGTVM